MTSLETVNPSLMALSEKVISLGTWLHVQVARWCGRLVFRHGRLDNTTFDLGRVNRVLVVRLDEIGDMILFSPFLRELRGLLPQAQITLVVTPLAYNLVELCPYVDRLLTYNPNVPRFWRPVVLPWRAWRMAALQLRPERYDFAILPRWDTDTCYAAYLAYFSDVPWRIGYSDQASAHKRLYNRGFDRLMSYAIDDRSLKHEVAHNLDIIRFLGGPASSEQLEVWWGDQDDAFAERTLREYTVRPEERIVGLGPSGGHSLLKQWPVEYFIELGHWLQSQYTSRILIVGGTGEESLGQAIEQAIGPSVINVVGKTTLRQMAALLKRCQLYIGGDAGPMHVAVATGIPVVALFGSSCYHRYGPWQSDHTVLSLDLPCSPCARGHQDDRCRTCIFDRPRCMPGLTVEHVQQAVEKILV